MTLANDRWHLGPLLLGLLMGLHTAPARAQAPAGDGILGEYYKGADFGRLVTRRYDATLAFDWGPARAGAGGRVFLGALDGLAGTTGERPLRIPRGRG